MLFQDRKDAGQRLAQVLKKYREADVIVFALPRGGVVLGAEIARELGAPLDLIITKKIGHPMNPEYAIGAIAEDGEPVCNTREVERINEAWFSGRSRTDPEGDPAASAKISRR
ncbi:phosphoribosyltransferase family protein [Proteiniclasticum sp. QWL-01]|uniref:phosphoribosyltransferase family protein n=1 Tax=Proteiniclasticum sp. QWL-01 TaxID=3036945 RepID=UPI00240FFE5C|nr:phosphoribosyltransferase family protein [Proteiniclasticum sp. QWL-01]WFF71754.1 phosphoribosyltransferase family protein [Proteiniclasticum sp. QWL-01]